MVAFLSTKDKLFVNPGVYELFGVDLILDESFNMSIIEVNPSPMIISNIEKKTKILD